MTDPSVAKPIRPGTKFNPVAIAGMVGSRGHNGFLGVEYQAHGPDWIELALPWREDLVGDVETGVLASGPIISLLDNATSISAWVRHGAFRPQVTLDLRIDYVRSAVPGRKIVARGECYQLRKSMAFVRAIAHDGDINDPVAHAAGIFIIIGESEGARS
jgi:uncharacterized protein (TIGR00369 family)